jgi:hypothetical protein
VFGFLGGKRCNWPVNFQEKSRALGDYLEQWRASVEQRLAQLDKLYSVVHAGVNEQRMLWLEIIIVIFFAFDLVILLVVKH